VGPAKLSVNGRQKGAAAGLRGKKSRQENSLGHDVDGVSRGDGESTSKIGIGERRWGSLSIQGGGSNINDAPASCVHISGGVTRGKEVRTF